MNVFKRVIDYCFKYLSRIIFGILAIIALSQCDLIITFIGKYIVDIFQHISTQIAGGKVLSFSINYKLLGGLLKILHLPNTYMGANGLFQLIIFLSIIIIINIIIKGFFVYAKEYLLNSAIFKSLRDIRQDIYRKVIKYPIKYYDVNQTGDLMARITNDVNMMQESFTALINIVTNFIQSLIFLSVLLYLNWQLFCLIIITFIITGYILKRFAIPIRKAQFKIVENISHITSFLQETLYGIKIIKIFVKEDKENKKFRDLTKSTYSRNMKSVRLIAFQKPINELLSTIGMTMVIIFSGYQMIKGQINFSSFAQFIFIAQLVYKPLKGIGSINKAIQSIMSSGQRILDLLDNPTEDEEISDRGMVRLDKIKGQVTFKNVSFEYKDNESILKNISFTAAPDQIIAFVGHSGSGKTTIVNLIPRFYEIIKGTIYIDGIDIRKIRIDSLREKIAMVPQDTFLFSGTIKDNISYSKDNVNQKEIIDAAKKANAHDFIMELKDKYESQVGEKGVQLSGGQKQRIAIARAILKDPKILILDEATSALDTKSELLVQQALNHLMQGKTTFVIAHRLSTIKNADIIVVLDKGQIVQTGTHDELIRDTNGHYYQLCHAQSLFK